MHHTHPRDAQSVKGQPEDDKRFFHEVANSLEGAEQVLIVGPSTAKLDFLRYIEKHDHAQGPKVVGVETVRSVVHAWELAVLATSVGSLWCWARTASTPSTQVSVRSESTIARGTSTNVR